MRHEFGQYRSYVGPRPAFESPHAGALRLITFFTAARPSHDNRGTLMMTDKAARDMLAQHWDQSFPIDPLAIAGAAGVAVYEDPALALASGRFRLTNGKPVVYVSRVESRFRQRSIVAHELGHFALGHGNHFCSTASDFVTVQFRPAEAQANRFAMELLMPEAVIRRLIEERGVREISSLAEILDVSQQAMRHRLQFLGWL